MPRSDQDLFAEEKMMPAMSFGEHIEDLRRHLILALLGLAVGVVIAFIPPLNLAQKVMEQMQEPAKKALTTFYKDRSIVRAKEAADAKAKTEPFDAEIPAKDFAENVRKFFPELKMPPKEALDGKFVQLHMTMNQSTMIDTVSKSVEPPNALISLAPLETFMVFFGVGLVTGLVLVSPWVFYQIWAFVAAGLYRHERHYVNKYLPFSIGLFLGGVFLCFFLVLPYTLQFLLDFNIWLGIEPTLRISDWISFATILPLVFGVCFQTPLVMMLLSKIGIFRAEDYRSKRKFAILIMVVVAAAITPTGDPFTLALLAVPMILLYELGILLVVDKPVDAEVPVEV